MKKSGMPLLFNLIAIPVITCFNGCFTMKVEPIKIEVTVKIQVEKDLNSFFDDIDSHENTTGKE